LNIESKDSIGHQAYDADMARKRHLLREAIEKHAQDLMGSVRVYVKRLGLATDYASVEALAEEILHDAVVTAFECLDKYDDSKPARPWLRGIAFNEVRRYRRTKQYEHRYFTPPDETPQVRKWIQQSDGEMLSEDEMFGLLYQSDERHHLQSQLNFDELLKQARDADQEILKLAFVEDLRGKALAAKLGIREGTAYTRLSRAIARVRHVYEQNQQKNEEVKQYATTE
jgi:RNA polymerase sigma-70 factor (ECF subfamily)